MGLENDLLLCRGAANHAWLLTGSAVFVHASMPPLSSSCLALRPQLAQGPTAEAFGLQFEARQQQQLQRGEMTEVGFP